MKLNTCTPRGQRALAATTTRPNDDYQRRAGAAAASEVRASQHAGPGRTRRRTFGATGVGRLLRGLVLSGVLLDATLNCSNESEPGGPTNTAGSGSAAGTGGSGAAGGTGGSAGEGVGGSAGVAGSAGTEAGGSGGVGGGTSGSGGSGGTDTGGSAGSSAGGSAGSSGSAGSGGGPDPSDDIYDQNRVPRFDIELDMAALEALKTAPDVYVQGNFKYEGESISNVGVRIKGEASQRTMEQKAAFKLKFDEFVAMQSFRGLRRLTLNNMVEDPSFIAERLAYDVFKLAGLPRPRCNHALVYVNDTLFGVYANLETEDKTFLRRWFSDDSGNLYEEGGKDFIAGTEADFDLETNETANDRSDLTKLIAAFETAKPDTFLADLGTSLDTEHYLRFTAAEAAANQWDMYSYTVYYPNNFRIYHDPTADRFVFLPWGMDMSMKPYRDTGKAFIGVFELARLRDGENAKTTAGLIFQRCLESPSCKATYTEVVRHMADLYEQGGLEATAQTYYEQIKEHVYADPRKEVTNEKFETAFQSVLTTIRGRAAALRADIAAP